MNAIAIFDIDGVIRDVSQSYRRALADTVEHFTAGAYRPTPADIDTLKAEGQWNNDWEASRELIYRYWETQGKARSQVSLSFESLVDFFQHRYRGPVPADPAQWTGYITQEPLLVEKTYFDTLTHAGIAWGFFSGATRGSAHFVLHRRLGLANPPLVAMEDAPGKPDPTGFFQVTAMLAGSEATAETLPVLYAGDTVADMEMVQRARAQRPDGHWIGVGILPPHVMAASPSYREAYGQRLLEAGATMVLPSLQALTPECIEQFHPPAEG